MRRPAREVFLEFPNYAALADLVVRAEETTRRHAEFVAHWQAAGSPCDPEHRAADDLLAAHTEASYLRDKIAATQQRYAKRLAAEVIQAREHPREGQLLVITHARITRLNRRPLALPKALRNATAEDVGNAPERHSGRRPGSDRLSHSEPIQAGIARQMGSSVETLSTREQPFAQLALEVS